MMWNKLILVEGIVSIPVLILAMVYFLMIYYPTGERARVVYTCMCSICPILLTLARQLISLSKLQQEPRYRWLGTRRMSSALTIWYFMCIIMLCMIEKSYEATCYIFLAAINLLITMESQLCFPAHWLVEKEAQVRMASSPEKYTTSMGFFGTTCMICLEEFEEEVSTVARLPCDHIFHFDCMERWLRHDSRCPLRCEAGPAEDQAGREDARPVDDQAGQQAVRPADDQTGPPAPAAENLVEVWV